MCGPAVYYVYIFKISFICLFLFNFNLQFSVLMTVRKWLIWCLSLDFALHCRNIMVHFMLTDKSDVSLQRGLISIASSVNFALISMHGCILALIPFVIHTEKSNNRQL